MHMEAVIWDLDAVWHKSQLANSVKISFGHLALEKLIWTGNVLNEG